MSRSNDVKIKIAVCDDDLLVANEIEAQLLLSIPTGLATVDLFSSGDELLQYLAHNKSTYNIYFIDIEMPGIDGIATAKYIRQSDDRAVIIFITLHTHYVYDVFEALPFRFLAKPISKERLVRVCDDAILHIKKVKQLFFFQKAKIGYQIPYDEIIYFESNNRTIRIHTLSDVIEYYGRISQIDDLLDKTLFLRIGVSFYVNMEYIYTIDAQRVVMKSGQILSISKRYRAAVKQAHSFYLLLRNGGAAVDE